MIVIVYVLSWAPKLVAATKPRRPEIVLLVEIWLCSRESECLAGGNRGSGAVRPCAHQFLGANRVR